MTMAILAASPILGVLLLMLAADWSAARAGAAALAWALGLTLFVFAPGEPGLVRSMAGVLAEAVFITGTILWILWPALALHHLQQHHGALETLRQRLTRLAPRPVPQAILIGWCLGLFLEGAAGFGTPVALVAPLLVGLGAPPAQAVVLALLGHAAGVCFGALGTPVAAQSALTGLSGAEIAWRTVTLNAVIGGLMMFFFMRALRASELVPAVPAAGDWSPGVWAMLATLAFMLPAGLIAVLLGPELPTLGGALFALLLLSWATHRLSPPGPGVVMPSGAMPLVRALAPYLVLVILVLWTRSWPVVAEFLRGFTFDWTLWDRFEGRMAPLLHPGTLLMAALLLGALVQRRSPTAVGKALSASAWRLLPVAGTLLIMLALSRLMLHAGMIECLQVAAVLGLGTSWPLLAPAVGALGSFVTGSATASNVLFSSLQFETALALGLSPAWIAAGQGTGAAIGNIICPHNIVAGAATVGLAGQEPRILRQTLLPCLAALLLTGVLLAVMLHPGD